MILKNKVVVIYGAGGAVGGAVARAFAREGAKLFLTGRHRAPVETIAEEVASAIEEQAMIRPSFKTTIAVNQSPHDVFNAINNVRGWWSENIEGGTDKVGDEFTYRYEDLHRCVVKVTESVPGKDGRLGGSG